MLACARQAAYVSYMREADAIQSGPCVFTAQNCVCFPLALAVSLAITFERRAFGFFFFFEFSAECVTFSRSIGSFCILNVSCTPEPAHF